MTSMIYKKLYKAQDFKISEFLKKVTLAGFDNKIICVTNKTTNKILSTKNFSLPLFTPNVHLK